MGRGQRHTVVPVRRCEAPDVAVLTRFEPAGRGYAEGAFARQERDECVLLVAWLDDVPVGSGEVEYSVIPELKNLNVRPEHRGHGIGRALVAAAEAEAAASGRIRLGVGLDNPDARRLYLRLGYVPTGELETVAYEYVDDHGVRRSATETAEWLERTL